MEIQIDGRGWHYLSTDKYQIYGNRYLGSEGKVFWNTTVAGESGPVNHYWVDGDILNDVSMHLWINGTYENRICVHGEAEGVKTEIRQALLEAIEVWEERLRIGKQELIAA